MSHLSHYYRHLTTERMAGSDESIERLALVQNKFGSYGAQKAFFAKLHAGKVKGGKVKGKGGKSSGGPQGASPNPTIVGDEKKSESFGGKKPPSEKPSKAWVRAYEKYDQHLDGVIKKLPNARDATAKDVALVKKARDVLRKADDALAKMAGQKSKVERLEVDPKERPSKQAEKLATEIYDMVEKQFQYQFDASAATPKRAETMERVAKLAEQAESIMAGVASWRK